MRLRVTRRFGDWRNRFALLPVKIDGEWVWLERYQRRFMGDFNPSTLFTVPTAAFVSMTAWAAYFAAMWVLT